VFGRLCIMGMRIYCLCTGVLLSSMPHLVWYLCVQLLAAICCTAPPRYCGLICLFCVGAVGTGTGYGSGRACCWLQQVAVQTLLMVYCR
jgi:hypothetical protein